MITVRVHYQDAAAVENILLGLVLDKGGLTRTGRANHELMF